MNSRKKLFLQLGIAGGFFTLVFAVCQFTVSATSPQTVRSLNNQILSTKTSAVLEPEITDQGGNRTITFYHVTDEIGRLTLDRNSEIDVTSITFSNGTFATGVSDKGGLIISKPGPDAILYMASDGFGTDHLTFTSPLMIRSGDQITLIPQSAQVTEWDITLQGRIPTPTGFKTQ